MNQTHYLLTLGVIFTTCFFPQENHAATDGLELHSIPNAEQQQAVCMDGSPAVYYIEHHQKQTNWLIMLGGGIPCGTLEHCERTLQSKVNMTSSKARWKYIKGKGLLSSDQSHNPTFSNWNKVFIPQCSMDVWIGNQKASSKTHNLAFQGGNIIHATIQTLKNLGLNQAENLLMVGNSAGGIGVMNHLDWIASQLPHTKVKGLADGSWVLDTQAFPSQSHIHHDIIQRFSTLSPIQVDKECQQTYKNEAWKCIMGEHIYPYIQTPLLIRISQTDPVHLSRLGITNPTTKKQMEYVQQHANQICQSLQHVKYYFSLKNTPHTVVKNQRVFSLAYQGQTFYDAISRFILNPSKSITITDCNMTKP